jgi:hypothetical protein
MTHTPGPWRVHSEVPNRIILNGSACYEVECSTSESALCNHADMRLIAAAPELLAALRDVADDCERRLRKGKDQGDLDTLRVCRRAIAKAEGRE